MENPFVWWRARRRVPVWVERTVVIVTLVSAIITLIAVQALAAATGSDDLGGNLTLLLIAVVSGPFSAALLLWMANRNKRQERLDAETREDAREAKAEEARKLTFASLELIKKQTDGVIAQVTALAKSTGHIEGTAEATKAAADTATTLALGQQQGRDAERERIATGLKQDGGKAIPVVDKITNEIGERTARALETLAENKETIEKKK